MTTVEEFLSILEHDERVACVPAGARERVWNALAQRTGPGSGTAPPVAATRPPSSAKPGKLLLASLVLGLGLLAGAHPKSWAEHEVSSLRLHAVLDMPTLRRNVSFSWIEPRDRVVFAPRVQPTTPPAEAARARSRRAVHPTSELRRIKAIAKALDAERLDRAAALVRAHEREFPSGVFVEERLALEIRVLCRSGQHDAGQAKAAEFRRLFPRTIHDAAIVDDCGHPTIDD